MFKNKKKLKKGETSLKIGAKRRRDAFSTARRSRRPSIFNLFDKKEVFYYFFFGVEGV
jgi:hypothetical protein